MYGIMKDTEKMSTIIPVNFNASYYAAANVAEYRETPTSFSQISQESSCVEVKFLIKFIIKKDSNTVVFL